MTVENRPDLMPDFLFKMEFAPGVSDPERLLLAASKCVKALNGMDAALLAAFPAKIRPVLVLEGIQEGSIKIWLKQFVEAVDDDAIKNLDWKPAVGKYLIKGKYALLKALSNSGGLPDTANLHDLSAALRELAGEADILRLPSYRRLSTADIAVALKTMGEALANLAEGERVSFEDDDGVVDLTPDMVVTEEDVRAALVAQTIESTREIFLRVRKPDFLGASKWEFRHGGRALSASITDAEWLARFQAGGVDIRPGDSLHAMLTERTGYGADEEVIFEEREISRVLGIRRPMEQGSLL